MKQARTGRAGRRVQRGLVIGLAGVLVLCSGVAGETTEPLIRIDGRARFFAGGEPKAVAVDRNGRRVAVSTWGGEVVLYDGPAARTAHVLEDDAPMTRLAFSPDGRRLLGVSIHGHLTVWDTRTRQAVGDAAVRLSDKPIRFADFSADASRLVFSDGRQQVRLVDLNSGETLSSVRLSGGTLFLRLSPDGRRFAHGRPEGRNGGRVFVHTVNDDADPAPVVFRVPDSPRLLCFSPDGQRLAVYCPGGQAGQALTGTFLYDSTTGKRIKTLAAARRTEGLEFSPDGRTVLVSYPSDGGGLLVRLPAPATRPAAATRPSAAEKIRIDWDNEYPKLVAYSPDGRVIAAATRGKEVVLYDGATGAREPPPPVGHASGITILAPAGPGRLLSGDSTGRVCLWGLPDGRLIAQARLGSPPWDADVSPDGRRLAIITSSGPVTCDLPEDPAPSGVDPAASSRPVEQEWRVRRLNDGDLAKLDVGDRAWFSGQVAWLDDGRIICTGFRGQRLYDADSGEPVANVPFNRQRAPGTSLSPDGRYFADLERNGSVLVGRSESGEMLTVVGGDAEPAGAMLTGAGRRTILGLKGDGQLKAVETFTGATLWRSRQLHQRSRPLTWAIRRDERLLALRGPFGEGDESTGPFQVRVFDMIDGRRVGELSPGMRYVKRMCFTHNGEGLAVGVTDGTVAVYAAPEAPSLGVQGEDLPKLWEQLASEKPATALRAVFAMTEIGAPAAAFLAERLRPASSDGVEKADRLIEQLDADTYAERQAASEALSKLGVKARLTMLAALEDNPSAEQRARLEALLAGLPARRMQRMTASREARAIEVLSRIGDPAARGLLSSLAVGAQGHWLTETARRALNSK